MVETGNRMLGQRVLSQRGEEGFGRQQSQRHWSWKKVSKPSHTQLARENACKDGVHRWGSQYYKEDN